MSEGKQSRFTLRLYSSTVSRDREKPQKPSSRMANLGQDLNLDCSTQNTSATHLIVTFNEHQNCSHAICQVLYPILIITIIIMFSKSLYVNYMCPDTELRTSGAPVLSNVTVPYNVVCTPFTAYCINKHEIFNVIELMAESSHLITSFARRE
jgi:hypothetical protein